MLGLIFLCLSFLRCALSHFAIPIDFVVVFVNVAININVIYAGGNSFRYRLFRSRRSFPPGRSSTLIIFFLRIRDGCISMCQILLCSLSAHNLLFVVFLFLSRYILFFLFTISSIPITAGFLTASRAVRRCSFASRHDFSLLIFLAASPLPSASNSTRAYPNIPVHIYPFVTSSSLFAQ